MEIKHKEPGTGICWKSKIEELDKKGQVLIGVNAFNNEDMDGDISKPGSFSKTLKENFDRVRWFLNHDVTILLGVPVKGFEDKEYLKMLAQFNLEKQISRDTYEDYKLYQEYGKSLEHSVGLQAVKYTIDRTDPEHWIRTITEWKLWEFSTLTHWGSNENTPLLGIKELFKDTPPEKIREILSKMNNGNYSDTRKQESENIYKSLFEIQEPSRITPKQKADLQTIKDLLTF